MSNCLTPDQLERLVTERLKEAERSPAAAHVEECSTCQHALQMITTGRETGGQPESEATEDDRVCAPVRASQGTAATDVPDRAAR